MLRNSKLKPIEDKETEELINTSLDETSDYLIKIASPEHKKVIQERLQHIDAVIMEPGKTNACREINGRRMRFDIPSYAAAFTTAGKVYITDNKVIADYYIYLRKGNNIHNIKHEGMHALSISRELEKINDNTYSVNYGLFRSYEEALEGENLLKTKSLYHDGKFLNEGMTDYLTYLSKGEGIKDSVYLNHVLLTQFLVGGNIENENNLIQAYVSNTVKDIENFENEFDSYMKDEGITYKDYAQLKNSKDIEKYTKLLKGAVSYRIKSSKTLDERNNEVSFYTKVLTDMKDNKQLNQALWFRFEDDLKPMISELQEHLDGLTVEKELDNDFSLTTEGIGNSTIHSPTELKREVEDIENENKDKSKQEKDNTRKIKLENEEQEI